MDDVVSFIKCIYNEEDTVHFRCLHDKKDPACRPYEFTPLLKEIDSVLPILQRLNDQSYGIFVSINGARRDEEVSHISAQFFECDDKDFDTQLAQIRDFALKPSIVVQTKKSLHVYFLMRDAKVEDFRRIQQKLAKKFGGDPSVVNLSRVMRIPGYNHCKQEPVMVKCIEFEPERLYTQEELESYLPELRVEVPDAKNQEDFERGTMEQLNYLCETCDFMKHCQDNAANLPEFQWLAMISSIIGFDGGCQRIHEFSKAYPIYSEQETNKKIDHVVNDGIKPVRCSTIADHGFVCPKLGKCKCKSPAAKPFVEKSKIKAPMPEWYDTSNGRPRLMPGRLARVLSEKVSAVYAGERYHLYKNGVFAETADYEVQNIIRQHLVEEYAKTNDINDTLNQWKLSIFEDADNVNKDKEILNLTNGLYNLRTGILIPHTKDYLSTIRIGAAYNPEADCPKFKDFLSEVLEDELVPVIQEIFGYIFSNYNAAQKAFIFFGVPRSGKSTLIKIIEALIGLQNCSHITLQGLNDRFSPSELYGKLLNTFSDLPSTPIEGASMFKSVVSGDAITVERKNRDSFSFIPTIKLLFSTNAMPQNINEKNDGFYRRLLIIRFLKQVETGKIITDLAEQLKDENDGIFLWGIKGLRRLINNNFQFSSASAIDEEVGKYKLNQNSALLFVDEECQLGSYYSILREDFYTFYEDYCKASGLKAFSKIRFNEAIQQEFSGKILKTNDSITRKAIWRGVRHNYLSSCRKDITDICLETLNDREAFLN
jgi:P4 family phage/plasmid primase-like protien